VTFGENRKPQRVSGVTIDITERKENEERQLLLAREVDHRARNALAVVQAIIRMSNASTMEAYTKRVEGRIRALSLSHDLLSKSRWQGADIVNLIREEVAPYQNGMLGRVKLDGPSIVLPPDNAQMIALAIHEFATNAAKYGSLSAASGSVEVRWQLKEGMIRLTWRENGGPTVEKPSKRGFGTKIIDASINARNGGSAEFEWRPEGLICELTWPHANGTAQHAPKESASKSNVRRSGPAILVVEDEPMVGMLTRDLLHKMGYDVVGPLNNIEDALRVGHEAELHCAVLDVNLAGSPIFPVARVLAARGIPFMFLTGYEEAVIDDEYRSRPILRKPIDSGELESALRSMTAPEAVAQLA
jgi:two-component sensor histidine kinase/CheY-like chemotaxis protein